MMSGVNVQEDPPPSIWNEVAELYGEGDSPFGFFSGELVRVATLSPGERVLDLGTGNGLGLIPAAQAVAPAVVVGVDFAAEMLNAARRRADASGVRNVELACMSVASLDFSEGAFDVALACSVFQFVDYSTAVLREWRRVLRIGGRLVLSVPDIGSDSAMSLIGDLISEHAARLPPQMLATLRAAQLNPSKRPDLRTLCLASGFRQASISRLSLHTSLADVDDWWNMQWSHGIRTYLRALDDPTLQAIKQEAATRLERIRGDDGAIPLTLEMTVCHARK
jgi:SAM-dependent methyltransferase